MVKLSRVVLAACLFLGSCSVPGEKVITIKGKVQFPSDRFNMEIVERNGFDKRVIDSCQVNEDGTYELKMKVERPGV